MINGSHIRRNDQHNHGPTNMVREGRANGALGQGTKARRNKKATGNNSTHTHTHTQEREKRKREREQKMRIKTEKNRKERRKAEGITPI